MSAQSRLSNPVRFSWYIRFVIFSLLLASCGLPTSSPVESLDDQEVPPALTTASPAPLATSTDNATTTRAQVFWLDPKKHVVPVSVILATSGPSAQLTEVMELLAAGPTNRQRQLGFSTALGPGVLLTVTAITNRVADIELTAAVAAPTADRLPLAVGQIVLTATSGNIVDAIRFVRDGKPVTMPLVGGALTSKPLNRQEYSQLLAPTAGR
jgi:spore germination protein GerM